MNYEPFSADF
jgi:mannosyltransferase